MRAKLTRSTQLPVRHSMKPENLCSNGHGARRNIFGVSHLPIRVQLVYDLADHVGGGGATNSGGGARLLMSSIFTDADQYDFDRPVDVEVNFNADEYRRIMDRINRPDDDGSPVSAFNSSI
jgi:hypothetical protein